MKSKMYLSRKHIFALGCVLFFISSSAALAADPVAHVEEIEGTAWAQSAGDETGKLDNGSLVDGGEEVIAKSHSDNFILSPTRRMRLQTINNITRSQQSIQRLNVPRSHMP